MSESVEVKLSVPASHSERLLEVVGEFGELSQVQVDVIDIKAGVEIDDTLVSWVKSESGIVVPVVTPEDVHHFDTATNDNTSDRAKVAAGILIRYIAHNGHRNYLVRANAPKDISSAYSADDRDRLIGSTGLYVAAGLNPFALKELTSKVSGDKPEMQVPMLGPGRQAILNRFTDRLFPAR